MPVPWKKVRISRLVNDHLNISQKRRDGSSLVVETGFPTSLIDLFIKNREKLKKPSRRRRQSQPIASPDDVYDPVIEGSPLSCPSPPPPPPPSLAGSPPPALARLPSPQGHTSVLPPPPPPPSCANEICAQGSSGGGAVDGVDVVERGGDVNGVLIGVLKVFVVVVLALATKRLTVGITISAVLLLLLEYVGKHFTAAMPAVQIGGRFSRYKKLEEKQEPSTKPVSFPLSTSSIQEIQPLEEIQPEDSLSRSRERTGYQETELVEMAMKRQESISDLTECKKKSRKAKIKSKMQKIVPKKFRGSKKEQDLPSPQIVKDEQCEDGSMSSSISECSEEEEDGKSSIICLDRRLSNVIEESETKIEERSCTIEARRYMLLCLIILAGLIGGRPFALALTLLWFLLLKLGQALPMIMSFNVKSG